MFTKPSTLVAAFLMAFAMTACEEDGKRQCNFAPPCPLAAPFDPKLCRCALSDAALLPPSLDTDASFDDAGSPKPKRQCFRPRACSADVPESSELCVFDDYERTSAGLWPVCLVSPEANMYFSQMVGSWQVETPGWTHSAYGLFRSTLSAENEQRCDSLKVAVPKWSELPEAGSPTCFQL